MWPLHVLPFRVSVDLGVIVMKKSPPNPKSKELKPHHHSWVSCTLFWERSLSAAEDAVAYTKPHRQDKTSILAVGWYFPPGIVLRYPLSKIQYIPLYVNYGGRSWVPSNYSKFSLQWWYEMEILNDYLTGYETSSGHLRRNGYRRRKWTR